VLGFGTTAARATLGKENRGCDRTPASTNQIQAIYTFLIVETAVRFKHQALGTQPRSAAVAGKQLGRIANANTLGISVRSMHWEPSKCHDLDEAGIVDPIGVCSPPADVPKVDQASCGRRTFPVRVRLAEEQPVFRNRSGSVMPLAPARGTGTRSGDHVNLGHSGGQLTTRRQIAAHPLFTRRYWRHRSLYRPGHGLTPSFQSDCSEGLQG
jgi:hypothetical protein